MKHLGLLASAYVLVGALVLPASILAQDEPATTAPATTAPATTTPATTTETTTAPAPAPAQTADPAPAQPAAPRPEPQVLADERDEAPAPKPKVVAAASGGVTIADFSFSPGTITINQGDTVTWTNNGPTPHSATANNGSFDTGILQKGQTSSHAFNQAGTFSYFCRPHPFMKGTVVVQAAQTGGGGSGGSSGGSGGSSGAGGSGSGSGSGGTTSASGTGATAAQSDGGPALPNTGVDALPLLMLGGLMLLLGFAVRRRTA